MPDIAMCDNDRCPVRGVCYRSPASGTKPSKAQTWALFGPEGVGCRGYSPTVAALAPRPTGPAA